jgi:hypothetical protein
LRRFSYGGNDAGIGPASAEVPFHEPHDLLLVRVWVLTQQSDAGHNHSGSAVSALERVGFEEGFLKRMQPAVFLEAFYCRDLLSCRGAQPGYARAGCLAINENGAGATLSLPATVFASGKIEVISQDTEQTAVGLCVDFVSGSINVKLRDSLHKNSSREDHLVDACFNDNPRRDSDANVRG